MKRALIPFLAFLTVAHAQVNFTSIPQKLQLYARNGQSDTGTVTISGTVNNSGSNYSGMRVKVYRNNSLLTTLNQNLSFTGSTASFSIPCGIKAELAEYKFEALGVSGSSETLLRSADSVICGDVYIITGQSNAEAHGFDGTSASANNSPYIRVLGYSQSSSDVTWRVGQGDGGWDTPGNTGQWGLRMARLIIDNHRIPVAIFNGNQSGQPISFFKRNDGNPGDLNTNYGRLLQRLSVAGLKAKVRAILWVQGENNSGMATVDYMTAFRTLRQGWKQDYPGTEKIYVFQLRNGCGNKLDSMALVLEAERRLGTDGPDMGFITMSAQTHDNGTDCHYAFPGGYALMGDNIFRLTNRDLYGVPDSGNIEPPAIRFAEISGSRELTLFFSPLPDSLRWRSGAEKEFKLQGASATVTAASIRGMQVRLTLSADAGGISSVSFLGHSEVPPEAMAANRNGVGSVMFYLFPVTTPAHRDSACVAAILKANGSVLPVDSVAGYSGQRIASLHFGGKKLSVIPADIGYMDSLKTLDLNNNLLQTLPREITRLSALTSINVGNNRLCGISDLLAVWIDRHATDINWTNTQRIDEAHYCNGTALRQGISKLAGSSALMTVRVIHNVLHIELLSVTPGCRILIVKQNGAVMAKHTLESKTTAIDMSGCAKGMYIVQVNSGNVIVSKKLFIR